MSEIPFAVHNPALLPADVLLGEFTARGPLLKTLLRIVRGNARGKPPQHAVLVGARGMGKTTTLWAVAHSVAGDSELARQWQPVVFDEESRRVGDLADFWLEAIRQWELATHSPEEQAERLLANAGEDLEARARTAFLTAVDRSGKRAALLIDNLNDVFASISEPEALHRLRAFLMEDDRVMIIGAATRHFDAITGLDEPFFDFFRIFELAALTLEEMHTTLTTLAERRGDQSVTETIRQRPGTIRSLHVLTGGNPRLIKTFYRLLAEGLRGDVRQDLERLVDEFTPYFKAILDALPMQQQRIIDAVALAWEPVEVATIAQATRLPSNQVSAQLRSLVRSGIVAEAAVSPKRKMYLLADRFSNIHYLMRHGRTARRRFDWFVLTLRALFPDREQANALARVARRTVSGGAEGMRDTRDLLTSALSWAADEDSRRRILHATIRETWDQESLTNLADWLDVDLVKQGLPSSRGEVDILAFFATLPTDLRQSFDYRPEDADWWYALTDVLEEKEAWHLVEAAYLRTIELDSNVAYPWNSLAKLLFEQFDRRAEAELACRKAIELDPTFTSAWNGLGIVLDRLGRFAESEAAYRKCVELDSMYHYAWMNLGCLLEEVRRPAEAETAYRKAVEIDPNYGDAWSRCGNVLMTQLNRPADAEIAYRKAIEIDPNDDSSWTGLGTVLADHLDRHAEAETAFRRVIEIDSKAGYAWFNLGMVLHELNRPADAKAAYRTALHVDPTFARTYSGLAQLLLQTDGKEEEAQANAMRGLALNPADWFGQKVFLELCGYDVKSWQLALPQLAEWLTTHRQDAYVFDFALNGFIRYAQQTSPVEAEELLATIPDPEPFEILRDAFRAHADGEYLHRLAPERRTLVLEIVSRISATPRQERKKRTRKPASSKGIR